MVIHFEILEKVKELLTKSGYKVSMATDKFKDASLQERIRITKEQNAGFHLSLSFYNVDQTKYVRKGKDALENYMIYPVVATNRDTTDFRKANEVSATLQSEIKNKRSATTKFFSSAFAYDIPRNGLLVSIRYKPNTVFYQSLSDSEYQQSLAEMLVTSVKSQL